MRPWAVRSASSASQPAKTKPETPACVSSVSSAPGRPASQTKAPARRKACVAGTASRAYTSFDEHRHASLAPEALNASIIASRVAKPSLPAASMPPAAKKFLAKVARAVKSEGVPRLARKIFGRVPVRASIRSEASRSASNGSASRMRGNGSNANVEGDVGATRETSSTATGASARSGKSLVPVNASLRRATASWRSVRRAATFFWIMPCSSAAHAPPARSISWNWVQAERDGERRYGYGVGAAEAGGDDRDGRAQHVHVRVALGHHPPSSLGRDDGRRGRELAGRLEARPQHPQRPQLGDGQELVDIGGEAEIDHAARGGERNPARFERAQIFDRHRQRVRQLLCFRAAGIVDRPAVSRCKWPAKTLRRQIGNGGVEDRHEVAPRQRTCAADRRGTDRVEAKTDIGGGGSDAAALDQRRQPASRVLHVRTEVEVERNAGVDVNALERSRDRRFARWKTVTVGTDRSSED